MRTTIDIDAEALQGAKERARNSNTTLGKTISQLILRGLANGNGSKSTKKRYVKGVPVFPSRGGVVTLKRIQEIMDTEGI